MPFFSGELNEEGKQYNQENKSNLADKSEVCLLHKLRLKIVRK